MTKELDLERAADLRQSGLSWKNSAKEMQVAYMTLFKRKEDIQQILQARAGLN